MIPCSFRQEREQVQTAPTWSNAYKQSVKQLCWRGPSHSRSVVWPSLTKLLVSRCCPHLWHFLASLYVQPPDLCGAAGPVLRRAIVFFCPRPRQVFRPGDCQAASSRNRGERVRRTEHDVARRLSDPAAVGPPRPPTLLRSKPPLLRRRAGGGAGQGQWRSRLVHGLERRLRIGGPPNGGRFLGDSHTCDRRVWSLREARNTQNAWRVLAHPCVETYSCNGPSMDDSHKSESLELGRKILGRTAEAANEYSPLAQQITCRRVGP